MSEMIFAKGIYFIGNSSIKKLQGEKYMNESKNKWVEKMREGMRMMMEACEESTYDEKSLGCEICPFGEICGPIPYDPDCWGKYIKEE